MVPPTVSLLKCAWTQEVIWEASLERGQANSEIAASLGVSVHTIERHLANVFAKLSVTNRAGAAAWAYRRGLVS